MPYLIDGHNLIPKLGLRLEDPDDELELVRLLQDFARIKRQQIDVYFDGAPAGQAGARKMGTVTAHFVRQSQTADHAIHRRLEALGKSAKNYVIISSDHEVQSAARTAGSQFVRSEEFVKQIRAAIREANKKGNGSEKLSPQEVDEWLKLFGEE